MFCLEDWGLGALGLFLVNPLLYRTRVLTGKTLRYRCRLKGGRYENVEGGNANTALVHFTGGVSFTLDPSKLDAATIFSKVDYCLSRYNGLFSCITPVRHGRSNWTGFSDFLPLRDRAKKAVNSQG